MALHTPGAAGHPNCPMNIIFVIFCSYARRPKANNKMFFHSMVLVGAEAETLTFVFILYVKQLCFLITITNL
jgi:hypothetical protein